MKNILEMIFILDRSGSMASSASDTINGFNAMIKKQQEMTGEAYLTTILFDHEYEVLHNRVNLDDFIPITTKDYYVRGTTALMDAIGKTINGINDIELKSHNKVFTIMTDGYENASREYNNNSIKSLIEQKKELGWEFIFIGANIDAVKEGSKIGVKHNLQSKGVKEDYNHVNAMYSSYRASGSLEDE